ncbi:neural cell adhesion molecule L1-like protein isoform X2 [Nelusetta ayraudi]|uniref:neural cell adhesion molecule L1-like protein isoform X2 n=1 Tax=Nelusetta ayraudi TaxID=303726 RepID=UPI003F72CED4
MASQESLPLATLGVITCLCAFHWSAAMDIPLEVLGRTNIEQLPTITAQSPSSRIAFPFDENFPMTCEAKGNPEPEFRWTKNGMEFEPSLDPRLVKEENSGTFVIPNNGNLTEYQGTYRCYASNRLGTAISQEIDFIVPNVPKFPKETIDPVVVEEGQAFVLKCNPPTGIPPLQIYWMTINLQHIEQDERVSMSLDGDLYFSHAEEKDSRRDYCCVAAFPTIRTIVQKTAMSVVVTTKKSDMSPDAANAILARRPSILTPSGARSAVQRVKGEDLMLECIAEGYPTPRVEWVKMGHQLPAKAKVENHGKLLIVPDVEQEDGGNYVCTANNLLGETMHYFTVTVEEPPEWESEPQSQLSMIGSEVVVKCLAGGMPEPSITWRVNGVPLHDFPAANRNVLGDTIVIRNAQASDSAVYQCEAANVHGKLLSNANIMIMNLAPVVLTPDEEEYSAVEGKVVRMRCEVFSSPPPDIYWSRGDSSAEPVQDPRFSVHADGTLEISGARVEDAGRYTCLGKNTEGTSDIRATLHVKDPTRIVVPPEDLHILIGTTAQLSCTAEYDASFSDDFELLWEKDGAEISLNDTEASRYFVENGVLQIVNVSHSDRGVYTCVARTPVDGDEASAALLVLDVPDAPEHLVLSEHKGKSVKLKWIPGDDHNSSTTEFVVEFEESQWEPGVWKELLRVPGNHHSAVLRLHGHVDYRFRVSAVNSVGRGRPSEASERYKTPPSAPDRNPDNIRIEGHVPHEMDINWEPLLPMEHNGPGLEYKVSYRRQDVEEDWREHMVKRHSFVVKNTPTFVPYEIKIQARNHQGWGPEPRVVSGYSGEDFPSAAPEDVAVEVINSSVVKVSWTRVHKDKLHGHLGGYRLSWWRLRSLADSHKSHQGKETLTFPGDRSHAAVAGLTPYSEYSLIVMTFNGRGNGPGSHAVNFRTPEGVPEKNPLFSVKDVHKHSVSLVWSPPPEPNGILSGYLLEYQLVNDTEIGPLQTVDISDPDVTKWTLHDLEPLTKYRFYLRSCTTVGCGPVASEESTTTLEHSLASVHGGISTQGWFIGLMCAIALLTLVVLIACFVNRNKGGKYSVKEKEDLHPDVESQGMNDDTFCEYSDNDEKPLKGSRRSLSGEIKAADSGDSLVDYADEDAQFNEDGSFIGEYAGRKEKRASAEAKAAVAQTPA